VEFTIRFDTFSRCLMTPMGLGRRHSRIIIDGETVHARMGWGFCATFPRSAVASTERPTRAPISRGVHGWRGSWLVNGAGRPLVDITLQPVQKARVCGFPVRLAHLIVSVDDPDGLMEALRVQ
jgi:hypothetical protein